jgi:hypothetical protein
MRMRLNTQMKEPNTSPRALPYQMPMSDQLQGKANIADEATPTSQQDVKATHVPWDARRHSAA